MTTPAIEMLARYRARRRKIFQAELETFNLNATLNGRLIFLAAAGNMPSSVKSLVQRIALAHDSIPEIIDDNQAPGTAPDDG
jgi:hypothetical protein